MTRLCLTTLLVAFAARPASADLRYTTRLEVHTKPGLADSRFATIARMVGTTTPRETKTFISADAARIEIDSPGQLRPTVVLIRNGRQTMLDPGTQTYWVLPSQAVALGPQASPTFQRTGEFTMLLGYRAERFSYAMTLTLPVTPPPGFPTAISMDGELWVADAYKSYAKTASDAIGAIGSPGLANAIGGFPDGMPLRHVVRNLLYGYELEYTVTELQEEPLDKTLFEVPPAYREVSAPPATLLPTLVAPGR